MRRFIVKHLSGLHQIIEAKEFPVETVFPSHLKGVTLPCGRVVNLTLEKVLKGYVVYREDVLRVQKPSQSIPVVDGNAS